MNSAVRLRHDVLPSDRLAIRRIVESTGYFAAAEVAVAVELIDERLAKGLASGYLFVFAERSDGSPAASSKSNGESVVGYACYGPIACTVGSYDLFWIAVDDAYRGQGLGRLLLEEVEALVRREKGRRIYIETSNRPQYVPTRSFYERCGYRLEAVLPEFYGVGDDKVVYVKVL